MPPSPIALEIIRKSRLRRQIEQRTLGYAGIAARLRAAAEANPGDPGLWGVYGAYVQRVFRPRQQRIPPKGGMKRAIVDPLELAGSHLTPDRLWTGPDPVWGEDPEWPGDPESDPE